MEELGWKRMSKKERERFRQAYRVLYNSEEEFAEEMGKFDPKFQVIPDVSFPAYRRALVGRLLSGRRRDTDPYRTGQDFHFEDVKYFLGDNPIDLFFYGNHEPKVIRMLFKDTPFGYGSSEILKLAKDGLDNVNVSVRHVLFGAWDSEARPGEGVLYYFNVTNPDFEEPFELSQRNEDETKSLIPLEKSPTNVESGYKGPLLIVQNKINYGRKNDDLKWFLGSKNLGIGYRSLVFNFIGRIDFNPWSVPSHYIKNVLRLI